MILGHQYSWENPWILIQTWADVWLIFDGTKSLVQKKKFKNTWIQVPRSNRSHYIRIFKT